MGWKDELVRRLSRSANVAATINVAEGKSRTSVHSHQRVVQRDGETTVVTTREISSDQEETDDRQARG